MRFPLSLFLTLSLFPLGAAAETDPAAAPGPAEIERAYQLLCVPGSPAESTLSETEKTEMPAQRARFQEFLADPRAVLEPIERALVEGDGLFGRFVAGIVYASSCGATRLIAPLAQAGGCRTQGGQELSLSAALAECARVEARVKASEQEKE